MLAYVILTGTLLWVQKLLRPVGMDGLKAAIAAKRKALEEDPRPNKYMRKGDIERMKEEQAQTKREEELAAKRSEDQPRLSAAVANPSSSKVCTFSLYCIYR
jgi:hypothetical protein